MIAKEGYSVVFTALALALALALGGYFIGGWISWIFYGLAIFTAAFTLYFFRDPERIPPSDAHDFLIAPADGKVILITDVHEQNYIKGPCKQISIFLSPLDVHINRVPAAGKVEYLKYHPGQYLVAWHEKASELNERSEFGVRHPNGTKIYFRQITGYIARRIVYDLKEGDEVTAGQRFGMMKFGSRMDILVPANVEIFVKENERTVAGISKMGVFRDPV